LTDDRQTPHRYSRRGLLVAGGAGLGLVVAWAAWPRDYRPNLTAGPGEHVVNAWLKIGEDGHVTVAVPQAEHGQGAYTALPQIAADALGADWRTVAVEAAPLSPVYANPLAADALFRGAFDAVPPGARAGWATRHALVLTAGSTSVRQFEAPIRAAGAAARALLLKAAARRWGVDWQACDTAAGFVSHGARRLRFGELAAAAAAEDLPDPVPDSGHGLAGRAVPRLDVPAKVDGSANFAADVRLPDMVFASVRAGPVGDTRLRRLDRRAADRVPGVVAVVENPRFAAAAATSWWAADRALDAAVPRFETQGDGVDTAAIAAKLAAGFDAPGERMVAVGDVPALFRAARLVAAEYRAAPSVHASPEPPAATAWWREDRLEVWLPTLAPGLARAAAARAIGVAAGQVVVHPMLVGGSFGQGLEHDAAAQAAVLAVSLKRPVQLQWSVAETLARVPPRAPAIGRLAARLSPNGLVAAWLTRIAAPATGREMAARLLGPDRLLDAAAGWGGPGDGYAVAGAVPPYRLPAFALDHHPVDLGLPTGHLRGGADGYAAFFTESFVDELAHAAGTEAVSFRIGMLGGEPRLARCLSTAAALGGWEGGVAGSGQGIACHITRGSRIAVLAEAHVDEGQRIRVDRLVAAADCGRVINPDLVRQQIEGGLVFGVAQALGASTGWTRGLPDARGLGGLRLPRLADAPDITVELIRSDEEPGGAGELAVAAVAPAIANALWAATGTRLRALPLVAGGG
jgi:isoquinoline 1-oxidoreductase subunit beta